MPRQRSPSRDEAKRMYLDSKGKMLLKDIAKAVGKQDTQIRRWKSLDHWDDELKGNVTIPNDNVTKRKNGIEKPLKTELLPEEIETLNNEELTPERQLFCIFYSKSFNATRSYQKAYDCDYRTALTNGPRLLGIACIKEEIMKLKEERYARSMLTKEDIFQKYMDIAFADITDFLEFQQEEVPVTAMFGPVMIKDEETGEKEPLMKIVNTVRFKDCNEVDGTLIGEVKQGKDGASIKLPDRMRALQWLSDHMGWSTDLQKAQLEQLRAQTDKLKADNDKIKPADQVVIHDDIPKSN